MKSDEENRLMKMKNIRQFAAGAILVGVLTVGLAFAPVTTFAAQGTATSDCNVRAEASSTSNAVGSVKSGTTFDVGDSTTNDAGETWYAVTLSSGTTGYIRSDLMSTGTADTTTTDTTADTTTTDTTTDATADATENAAEGDSAATAAGAEAVEAIGDGYAVTMTPTNATVSGDVNVRSGAGTSYTKIGELSAGTALVAIGQAKDSAGDIWYQFYTVGLEQQMTGFIRYDYITLGDAVTATTTDTTDEAASEATTETPDYEAVYTADESGNDTWYLYNNAAGTRKKIDDIDTAISAAQEQATTAEAQTGKYRNAAILILVLLAAAVAAIVGLILKVKRTQNESGEIDLMQIRQKQERSRQRAEKRGEPDRNGGQDGGRGARPASGGRQPYPAGGAGASTTLRSGSARPMSSADAQRPVRTSQDPQARNDRRYAAPNDMNYRETRTPGSQQPMSRQNRSDPRAQEQLRSRRPAQSEQSVRRESAAPASNFANINAQEAEDDDEFGFLNIDSDDKN